MEKKEKILKIQRSQKNLYKKQVIKVALMKTQKSCK